MASCSVNNCTTETSTKDFVEIVRSTVSVPPPSVWGTSIKIGIDIVSKSQIVPDRVYVDLYDLSQDPGCIDSTGEFVLNVGQTKHIIFSAKMPPKGNLDLRVSVSSFVLGIFLNTWGCQDSYDISIRGIDPSATHLVCNGKTKTCVNVPGVGANLDGCNFVGDPCGGVDTGAGTTEPVVCDSTKDMNIMGICVPKPLVLGAFALGAIYIFKSS